MKRSPLKRKTPLQAKTTLRRTARLNSRRAKSALARREAAGKPCMVRLIGCDGGGETTVLAHYRLAGTCGVGMKPPDELGAWCCNSCHAIVDGRAPLPPGYSRMEVRLAHAEGCLRTLYESERVE